MTVYRCVLCRKQGHNRRTCPSPRDPKLIFKNGRWRSIHWKPTPPNVHDALDGYILDHLGRTPVASGTLRKRVIDDYGHVNVRTFYRHLDGLRRRRRLMRVELLLWRDGARYLYARKR